MQGTVFESWFASEIGKLYEHEATPSPGVLFGLPVWGERYVDRLMRYTLSSLMTTENRAALQAMGARFVFFTDDVLGLWRRVAFLERAGLPVQIRTIPAEVIKASAEGVAKYHLLGTVQNLCVQMAARNGRGFYMLMPDVLYSRGYFDSLLRLQPTHDCIVQNAPGIDIEGAAADIEGYRQPDGSIALADIELGDLCWKHLHASWRTALADAEGFRFYNLMAWRGRNGMHIASPLMPPVWLSPKLCREVPVLVPAPLDADVALLVPQDWYMPVPTDGMTMIEMSDSTKPSPTPCKFPQLIDLWWRQMNFNDAYLAVAARRFTIPMSPVADAPSEEDIATMHTGVIDALAKHKSASMERFLHGMAIAGRRMKRHSLRVG